MTSLQRVILLTFAAALALAGCTKGVPGQDCTVDDDCEFHRCCPSLHQGPSRCEGAEQADGGVCISI